MRNDGLRRETLVSLTEAEQLWGQPGRRTVFRWMMKGLKTPSGTVKLERTTLDRSLCTSVEAFERFIIAQNAPKLVHYMLDETVIPIKVAKKRLGWRSLATLESFRIGKKLYTTNEALERASVTR
jgi:hypothetical protein